MKLSETWVHVHSVIRLCDIPTEIQRRQAMYVVKPLMQWKINMYYIFWVRICSLFNQHAMRMRHTVICDLSGSTLFFHHYLIKGVIKKKALNIKCVFRFSLQVLSEIYLILKRREWDMIRMYIYFSNSWMKTLRIWSGGHKSQYKKVVGFNNSNTFIYP
jgi:hypothetical protein